MSRSFRMVDLSRKSSIKKNSRGLHYWSYIKEFVNTFEKNIVIIQPFFLNNTGISYALIKYKYNAELNLSYDYCKIETAMSACIWFSCISLLFLILYSFSSYYFLIFLFHLSLYILIEWQLKIDFLNFMFTFLQTFFMLF